jgi:hypothetical protein
LDFPNDPLILGLMRHHLLILLVFITSVTFGQGSTCGTAINLLPDSVCRNYFASGATGAALNCNVTGNQSNVTWFAVTTDAAGTCPRINIKTTPAIPFEIVVYDGCNGSASQYLYPQSLCSLDGDGLWSPDSYNFLQPNTTYYFRIRTQGTFSGGVFNICTSWNTNTNDNCPTAMPIDPSYQNDDNGCNTPGPNITAQSICAFTLENTAWYSYTIALDGNSIINIKDIDCDNSSASAGSSGFQIGFFTGGCAGLQQMPPCTSGTADGNGFVQFTSPYFLQGTQVFVAIDGVSGANCTYQIMATNSVPLSLVPRNPTPRPRTTQPLFSPIGRNLTVTQDFILFDIAGRLVKKGVAGTYSFASGIYVLRIKDKSHRILLW